MNNTILYFEVFMEYEIVRKEYKQIIETDQPPRSCKNEVLITGGLPM